jgi:fido (protein-threonine AMPylation protein)
MRTGELRTSSHEYGLPPAEIHKALTALIKQYEAKKEVSLRDILDFHVQFERIHPFEDGNGRLGRLIMVKECLRHQIVPFIIDDKHRSEYHKGIINWDINPSILGDLVLRAQGHFEGKMDLCKLFQYQRTLQPE